MGHKQTAPYGKRELILNLLVDGSSMRSISSTVGVSINTVTKLLVDAGEACAEFHHKAVRNVQSKVGFDEIWSFCHAKQKNVPRAAAAPEGTGNAWIIWTVLGADSKMIISYLVSGRDSGYTLEFLEDVKSSLTTRVQLTSDEHKAYLEAMEDAFADVDYAKLVQVYGDASKSEQRRDSSSECTRIRRSRISGNPDPVHISTNYVERQNLTMRMSMRRFTRLTTAFSMKIDNHIHMLSL